MRFARPLAIALIMLLPLSIFAQEGFDLGMDLGLGTTVIEDPVTGEAESWQNLSLRPDLAFGNWGIGLAIDLNFSFSDADGNPGFRIREEDWIPGAEYNFLELYLPIFRYVRYGYKGDPIYGAIGAIDNFLLGNGFIIGNYANTLFLPEQRITGFSFDLDGNLFGFPYVGIETFVGNVAAWDLMGARVYTRPIYWTGVPIIKELQLGASFVGDRNPYYFRDKDGETLTAEQEEASVFIWGADLKLPVLANPAISLAAFSDLVFQNGNAGGMLGFGGKLINLITYGAQIRFLGENFIPVYFDASYDLYRELKYAIYSSESTVIEGYTGWFGTLGFDALESQIVFSASIEGPFGSNPDDLDELYPTLNGGLHISDELLMGFSFDAMYQKKYIRSLSDLISPENALISAKIGYNTGPATIGMIYDLKYNPFPEDGEDPWTITTKLETTISLFN